MRCRVRTTFVVAAAAIAASGEPCLRMMRQGFAADDCRDRAAPPRHRRLPRRLPAPSDPAAAGDSATALHGPPARPRAARQRAQGADLPLQGAPQPAQGDGAPRRHRRRARRHHAPQRDGLDVHADPLRLCARRPGDLRQEPTRAGKLGDQKEIEVFNGSITPGNHTLSVQMIYQGNGYGVFSYLKGYKFTAKSSRTFTAPEGKQLQLKVVGFEKGNPVTTDPKDRPAVDFRESLVADKDTRAEVVGAGEEVACAERRRGRAGRFGAAFGVGASAARAPTRSTTSAARSSSSTRKIGDLDGKLKPPPPPGPEIADRRLIDAQVLYELKNYEAASIILFDVVEKYPNSPAYPEALYYLADSLYPEARLPLVAPLLREDRRAGAGATRATRSRCSGSSSCRCTPATTRPSTATSTSWTSCRRASSCRRCRTSRASTSSSASSYDKALAALKADRARPHLLLPLALLRRRGQRGDGRRSPAPTRSWPSAPS